MLSRKTRHVDESASHRCSNDSHTWSCCCEHAGSDDFRRAIRLLQPHLPLQQLSGICCLLRPAELQLRSQCNSKGRGATDVTVRVWLGAGGASHFILQAQSATGVTLAPNSTDKPLFEIAMPSGATVHLHGMINYGVVSYYAALGQLLNTQTQAQQLRAHASPVVDTPHRRASVPAAVLFPAAAPRHRSHMFARSHTTRCGGGGLLNGPLSSSSYASAAGASGSASRLARSVCSIPSREGFYGGGRLSAAKAVLAAAAKCRTGESLDMLLQAADLVDGGGGAAGQAAAVPPHGGLDRGDDDLKSDVAAGGGSGCRSAGGSGGGSGCKSAGGGKAQGTGPKMRVTAWMHCDVGPAVPEAKEEEHRELPPAATLTVAADSRRHVCSAERMELPPPRPPASLPRCRQAAVAVGDGGDEDVASDAGASKIFASMRWAPDARPRRNAHLLDLLGLPPEARSLRIPVPDPDSEVAEPDGLVLADPDEFLSFLGLPEEDAPAAGPDWAAAAGFGYAFAPLPPPAPLSQAMAASLLGGSCPVVSGKEGSYSLEGSCLGVSVPAATAAGSPSVLRVSRRLMAVQLQQRLLLQQARRRPGMSPAAVEVLNLLGGGHAAAAAAMAAAPGCTDFAVSYIDSLDLYGKDELGGGSAMRPSGDLGYPSTDLYSAMFGDDEIVDLHKIRYDGGAPAVAAGGGGGGGGACSCRWCGGGGGGGASELPAWPSGQGCGPPPPPLLTSLTAAGAVWL